MERMTQRIRSGEVLMVSDYEEKYTEQEWINVLQNRLAAYEDTGLTPEEIERSKLEIEAGCVKAIARTYGVDINRLRKLAEADKAGRLVVLPFSDADDVEMQRDGITYKSDHWNILLTAFADDYLTLSGRKLGLFSVKEAEKALEAMKDE